MGDTGEKKPAAIPMTDEQLDDFARLLARHVTRGNIEWLATSVLGRDAIEQAGNEVGDTAAFARRILATLDAAGRIPQLLVLLRQESHHNSLLTLGLNNILGGIRLDDEEAKQRFVNEYEPFLNVAKMRELLPRVLRTVCAVGLGDPVKKIVGSGFLITPDVVLTNFHVLEPFLEVDPATKAVRANAPGDQLFFFFDYLWEPAPDVPPDAAKPSVICVRAAPDWLLHARRLLPGDGTENSPATVEDEYDYAVIKLERRVGALPARLSGGVIRGWLPLPKDKIDMNGERRVMVFQHPQRSPQQFDIGKYVRRDPSGTRVWYSVSTAHGSSGGAAVDNEGQLFALHNAEVKVEVIGDGGERLKLNQGVRIDLIVEDLSAALPDVVNVAAPAEDPVSSWSLTDSLSDPSPVIGRREFREKVVSMFGPNAERVLVVTGPPASGLRYSVKLLRHTLGSHVPVVEFKPGDLQGLGPKDFLRALCEDLGLLGLTAMPEARSTEDVQGWLRYDLPLWLSTQILKDEERDKRRYPAWVVIDTVIPDKRLLWADNLKELVAALVGVHDPGQPTVDVSQLRWLFLASNAGGLPVTGVNQFVEDLGAYTTYEADFAECLQLAWRTIDKTAPIDEMMLRGMGRVIRTMNEMLPQANRLALRKALSNGVREIINRDPQAGG